MYKQLISKSVAFALMCFSGALYAEAIPSGPSPGEALIANRVESLADALSGDISRGDHLVGLTSHMEALDELSYNRFVQRSNLPPASLLTVIERSRVLPGAWDGHLQELNQKMEVEVPYGLGHGKNSTTLGRYLDEWGKDKKAINAGFLLNSQRLRENDEPSALRLVRNLTIPFPSGTSLNDNDAEDLADSLAEYGEELPTDFGSDKDAKAKKYMSEAMLSVAQNTFLGMMARRLPQEVEGGASGSDAPSLHEIMNTESLYRIEDPQWHQAVAVASSEALLREMIHMQAYQMWLNHQRYLQGERLEALMATMLGAQNKLIELADKTASIGDDAQKYAPKQAGVFD